MMDMVRLSLWVSIMARYAKGITKRCGKIDYQATVQQTYTCFKDIHNVVNCLLWSTNQGGMT